MAVVNHESKFIWFAEPHVASRASAEAILKYVPGSETIVPHHIRPDRIEFDITDYKIIANVRNPYDVLITKYLQPKPVPISFVEYVDIYWYYPVLEPCMRFCDKATHICWYEFLLKDMRTVFNCPELELSLIEKHCTQNKKDWWTYYTPEVFQRVSKHGDWKKYLSDFGYQVDINGVTTILSEVRERLCKCIW
jgi:hypothetical protein